MPILRLCIVLLLSILVVAFGGKLQLTKRSFVALKSRSSVGDVLGVCRALNRWVFGEHDRPRWYICKFFSGFHRHGFVV